MITVLGIAGCGDDPVAPPGTPTQVSTFSNDVATQWFDLQLLLAEKTAGFTPPVASRAFGYSGVALYEALVPGMSDHRSLQGIVNGLSGVPGVESGKIYHWALVANGAMARITRHMFANATPQYKAMIDSLERAVSGSYSAIVAADVAQRSDAYGGAVADVVFEWSKTDGGHEGYSRNFPTSYTPPVGPGLWVPTPRRGGSPQSALQPYWGSNRPFILPANDVNRDVDPGAPYAYSEQSSSDFYKDGMEVYTAVRNLTAEQLAIALFWSDDPGTTCTPPGHSISILTQALRMTGRKLDAAAEAYARMGIALADAFTSCWAAKYKYNLLRPLTYIQRVIDPTWNRDSVTDPLATPPFPEYPSGHSVQSGAASEVLTMMFGTGFSFTDHTHDIKGKPSRSYGSFHAFADEAAISRLYGGIHFRAAIERGVKQGRKIGAAVNAISLRK